EGLYQFPNRLVHPLRRQLKRAVVHGETAARAEIEVGLHRFRRIHVDVFHEPTWLVGADGEQRKIDRREPRGDLAEMGAIAGIAGKEHAAPAGLDQESAPRSEEHTSELQSRGHLVCRLLLEKKKKKR